jgi:hypothetical protein
MGGKEKPKARFVSFERGSYAGPEQCSLAVVFFKRMY